jgi:hypothetical protein
MGKRQMGVVLTKPRGRDSYVPAGLTTLVRSPLPEP